MPFDPTIPPPTTLAPKSIRPELLVDQYRFILIDPTDQSMVGFDGAWGAAGYLGRLVYAQRTLSNRGY